MDVSVTGLGVGVYIIHRRKLSVESQLGLTILWMLFGRFAIIRVLISCLQFFCFFFRYFILLTEKKKLFFS